MLITRDTTPDTDIQDTSNAPTLTPGSWAGIGVVVAVITIALVGLGLFLVRMRRKTGDDDLLDGRWDGRGEAGIAERGESSSVKGIGSAGEGGEKGGGK